MRIEEVFFEAKEYRKSVSLNWRDEEAYIYRGIKISKLDDDIKGLRFRALKKIHSKTEKSTSFRTRDSDEKVDNCEK